jgi:hypothetical protein
MVKTGLRSMIVEFMVEATENAKKVVPECCTFYENSDLPRRSTTGSYGKRYSIQIFLQPTRPNTRILRRNELSTMMSLFFVAFVASTTLRTTIKRNNTGPSVTLYIKASLICFIVKLGSDIPLKSTRTKLLTATPSLLVVCPIPRVVTSRRVPPRREPVLSGKPSLDGFPPRRDPPRRNYPRHRAASSSFPL